MKRLSVLPIFGLTLFAGLLFLLNQSPAKAAPDRVMNLVISELYEQTSEPTKTVQLYIRLELTSIERIFMADLPYVTATYLISEDQVHTVIYGQEDWVYDETTGDYNMLIQSDAVESLFFTPSTRPVAPALNVVKKEGNFVCAVLEGMQILFKRCVSLLPLINK